jgi:hypothetical protein
MELKSVSPLLKWVLTSKSRFGHRVAMLVDAKAMLAAVAKGRSGSPEFARTLAHVSALELATNTLLRLVYIPSEDNPADAPSRGARRRPACRRASRPVRHTHFDKMVHKRERAWRRLRACGQVESIMATDSSAQRGDHCW